MKGNLTELGCILRQSKDYESLVAAVLYLMTRYLQSGSQGLSNAVAAHLAALADHPDCPNACLANTARRLSEEWSMLNSVTRFTAGGLH